MFTHKSIEVWEDLALIMWSAGLQVKQGWSVATETARVGVRIGNFVQAIYNMVLRKRTADRTQWCYSPTRHIYHALKLLEGGADVERAVKHLVDSTDFWNIRTARLSVILSYLKETTATIPHWEPYQNPLASLEIGVEHWKA